MENKSKKNYIVVKNVSAYHWYVNSLLDAANEDGLEVEEYSSHNDVLKYFSDIEDVPEGYLDEAEKIGYPCVHVFSDSSSFDFWKRKEEFNAEFEARNFLLADCKDIIPIESKEDAMNIIKNYNGNHRKKVRELAERILSELSALEN